MKAMVLAAGLGTRLRPLTNDRPKALVEIDGRTMLELTLHRLRSFGVTDVIVNTHHFAEQMRAFIESRHWGMRVVLSHEEVLLDTGGALKHAAHFFAGSTGPFILHNVDVLSNIDLAAMLRFHQQRGALATLAVQQRDTSRYLLFEDGILCGRRKGRDGQPELVRPAQAPQPLAFCGIHILSPQLLPRITEHGVFSIIDAYLRLAANAETITAFRADQYLWRDLGKPESVTQAANDLRHHRL